MTESPAILVVEDDELSSFMVTELLSVFGVAAEVTTSASQCLDRLAEVPGQFKLVLMDIHMPGMTGDQAASQIRSMAENPPKDVPIVAVTADPEWSNPARRAEVGLSDYLPKPIGARELANLCRRFGVDVIEPLN